MSDIFISYKREDQPIAKKLADALQREGWDVWWDPKLRAGEHFDEVIEKALHEAKCVVVIWSQRSVESRYVRDEATYALERHKLIPIEIENVNLPFRFKGVHTLSLRGWDRSNVFPPFVKLVDDIAALIGKPAARSTTSAERQLSKPAGTSFDITISQPRGHGDNLHSVYGDSDPRLVVIRGVTVVNRSDKDDVVALKLWLPLNNDGLLFSPQTTLPSRDIGQVSLLKAVENIPARQSATGDLLFMIPRNSIQNISASFFVIIVTSQLTGVEYGVNTLTFTEVKKPYPRNLDELNKQLTSPSPAVR